ncbi:alpha-mannosidase [Alkalicoccus daliensis]|uniref:Alpha-mannosidase n=1 Tax=Alkalicoccus daliensis TaxID=745820 RepID=A0A1H0HA10_9BACI|nr:alpha-mannosidase [Alkalicoccus daliensis]SDO15958.1 alpha-mannosidase [Alkalicoccus daliensis]
MFLMEQKLNNRIKELNKYRYILQEYICNFYVFEEPNDTSVNSGDISDWELIETPSYWKGWDRYLWVGFDITVPDIVEGRRPVGFFDFGSTGHGNNSGFESQLYIDNQLFQGVDSNHQEVFFKENQFGKPLSLRFRLWSGLDGMEGKYMKQEHLLHPGMIGWLDEATDDLYFNSRAIIEACELMNENDPVKIDLLSLLDKTYLFIDWSNPGDDTFYASIKRANTYLTEGLEQMNRDSPITITALGHTHIDVAWLWRLKHTREKCGRSFSTVLRLMEMFPEYIFLQTQPQLYEYVKEDYPALYSEIKERIEEGRWEAGGSMWLESDANLPSGESLVRQLLKGQAFFDKEFGENSQLKYLWLPDVFGYSWALPQILKKSGISTFMTTKISWNQYNRMPHDTFMWRGIDGSEILTHFITTPDPSGRFTYNGMIDAESVNGIWEEYQDKNVNKNLLLAYGYGDGGGGVTRDMLEMRRRFDKIPGMPRVKTGRADDYFNELKKTIDNTNEYVHTWDGELYLEYHRGTYTSQAYNKNMNRKLELQLRYAEILLTQTQVINGEKYPSTKKLIDEAWIILLRNQFHDIIPGSSIREVYEDSKQEYEEAFSLVTQALSQTHQKYTNNNSTKELTVFNSSSWEQSDYIELPQPGEIEGEWKDALGNVLHTQISNNVSLVYVKSIPALSSARIVFEPGKNTEPANTVESFEIKEQQVVTPFYDITWNDVGQLTKIKDLENDKNVLTGEPANVFKVFEDKPLNFEAWDIDIFYQKKYQNVEELISSEIIEKGPLRYTIRFKWNYKNSIIEQDMMLYSQNRRIDFATRVNWQEHNQLLKVAFPVNIRATEATYDIQFGNVKRPTHWNTSWDMARFETVAHQWADLSERNYGVSLLNDSKYGYDIKNNIMRLSLIKSAVSPDASQDQGDHFFTYALYPHKGDWYEGGTVKAAWQLNQPFQVHDSQSSIPEKQLFYADQEHIMIDAVKPAEDGEGIVLRIHEYSGQQSSITLKSDFRIKSWQHCDLMERPEGTIQEDRVIYDEIQPYEIKTYLIYF